MLPQRAVLIISVLRAEPLHHPLMFWVSPPKATVLVLLEEPHHPLVPVVSHPQGFRALVVPIRQKSRTSSMSPTTISLVVPVAKPEMKPLEGCLEPTLLIP